MKNNSEKETKKKRGKSIGCGCLSIFVLGFILIGIFADDPKPENENSEQKTESTVATKQEQIKTEVSKAASTPEKEESATDNSEAEKMQDAIDIYYEKNIKDKLSIKAIITDLVGLLFLVIC